MPRTEGFTVTNECHAEVMEAHRKIGMGTATHEQLLEIVKRLPSDFDEDGGRDRDAASANGEAWQDCSMGCQFFHILYGPAGGDWGVCVNPKSPRCGLLTFEHMGCPEYTHDPRWEQFDKAELKIMRKHKRLQKAATLAN